MPCGRLPILSWDVPTMKNVSQKPEWIGGLWCLIRKKARNTSLYAIYDRSTHIRINYENFQSCIQNTKINKRTFIAIVRCIIWSRMHCQEATSRAKAFFPARCFVAEQRAAIFFFFPSSSSELKSSCSQTCSDFQLKNASRNCLLAQNSEWICRRKNVRMICTSTSRHRMNRWNDDDLETNTAFFFPFFHLVFVRSLRMKCIILCKIISFFVRFSVNIFQRFSTTYYKKRKKKSRYSAWNMYEFNAQTNKKKERNIRFSLGKRIFHHTKCQRKHNS